MIIVPHIGSKGVYSLKEPFQSKILNTNTIYECKAIRRFEDFYSVGADPYTQIYKPVGISEDEFNKAKEKDIAIISLQSDIGDWLTVPSDYILNMPDMNGVTYRIMGVLVKLGAVPDKLDLDNLKDKLKQTVLVNLGLSTATCNEVILSKPSIVDVSSHEIFTNNRLEVIRNNKDIEEKNIELINENALLREKLNKLEQYIIALNK